jgi:tetratricopeptide (TPR) repeat protein
LWRLRADLAAVANDDAHSARLANKAATLPCKTVRDLYWQASVHFSQGRPGEALPLLHEATRREPDNFWAWFVLANCYDRLGQDVRAESAYATCTALMPDFAWSHFNRGLALLRQRDYTRAITQFDSAIRLKPDLIDAIINRALAHQGDRDYRNAIADLTTAIEQGSTETRLYFLRSRLQGLLGDATASERDLEEGLRRQPRDEKSWIARGLARLTRDPQAALNDFEQALLINPASVAALHNSAHVLAEKLHRPQEALALMERAVAAAPESGSTRSGRGIMLARLGQRTEALRDAEDSLLLDASAARQYQAACIYAMTSTTETDDQPRALQLLWSAVRAGAGLDLIDTDHDLDPLRPLPEFQRLVETVHNLGSNTP